MLSDRTLEEYDYASDPLLRQSLHARDRADIRRILQYGASVNRFGRRMMAHQNRVAKDGARLLRHLGHSDRAARNFRAAMLFHDIGKIHEIYTPALWMTEDRPTRAQKLLQRRHTTLGAEMFREAAADAGLLDHPHYAIRHAVTLYHHERLDGKGPEGMNVAQLPVFVQASCIVDAYDGDRIYRPHQKKRRTKEEALARMTDPKGKYKNAFDPDLLRAYVAMKMAEN